MAIIVTPYKVTTIPHRLMIIAERYTKRSDFPLRNTGAEPVCKEGSKKVGVIRDGGSGMGWRDGRSGIKGMGWRERDGGMEGVG